MDCDDEISVRVRQIARNLKQPENTLMREIMIVDQERDMWTVGKLSGLFALLCLVPVCWACFHDRWALVAAWCLPDPSEQQALSLTVLAMSAIGAAGVLRWMTRLISLIRARRLILGD